MVSPYETLQTWHVDVGLCHLRQPQLSGTLDREALANGNRGTVGVLCNGVTAMVWAPCVPGWVSICRPYRHGCLVSRSYVG